MIDQIKGTTLARASGKRFTKLGGELTAIRTEEQVQKSLLNACRVAKVCENFRGRETIVLDMTPISPLFDYFVVSSANSRRQLHAIADTSDDIMQDIGSNRMGREGYDTSWICQDYGDVVLHVFTPETREIYNLEHLWADAPHIDWEAVLAANVAE